MRPSGVGLRNSLRRYPGPLRPGITRKVPESGAQKVFGVSVSALIALQAARTAPAIRPVASYEPALLMATSGRYTGWVRRFDQEIARGQMADALITSLRGLDLGPAGLQDPAAAAAGSCHQRGTSCLMATCPERMQAAERRAQRCRPPAGGWPSPVNRAKSSLNVLSRLMGSGSG